jgi:hypothetical protein
MSKESDPRTSTIPKRPLGKTGHQVTIYILGGLFTVARHDRHDAAVVTEVHVQQDGNWMLASLSFTKLLTP